MRHRPLIALASLALLAACGPKEPELQRQPVPPPTASQRMKVLNADVFVIDGQHIRLADSYAPQPVPDARCWAEALAAKFATQQVRSLVDDAQDVTFTPNGKRDEYNRAIAAITLDNADLGRTLHDLGFAATKSEGRFEWCEGLSNKTPGAPELNSLLDLSR